MVIREHMEMADSESQHGRLGAPAQPSPTIGPCLNGGLGWLEIEIECNVARHGQAASLPLDEENADQLLNQVARSPMSVAIVPAYRTGRVALP
jgi:hypothetical protein